MKSWLDKLFKARSLLQELRYDLNEIADALRVVGNKDLAETLETLAYDARDAEINISEGIDDATNELVRGAEQGTVNMMKALLTAAMEGQDEPNTEDG